MELPLVVPEQNRHHILSPSTKSQLVLWKETLTIKRQNKPHLCFFLFYMIMLSKIIFLHGYQFSEGHMLLKTSICSRLFLSHFVAYLRKHLLFLIYTYKHILAHTQL